MKLLYQFRKFEKKHPTSVKDLVFFIGTYLQKSHLQRWSMAAKALSKDYL